MENPRQIYFRTGDELFQIELKKLKEWDTTVRNKELITSFQNHLFASGSRGLRVAKLSSQLRRMCMVLARELDIHKNLDELECEDVQALMSFYARQQNISEATQKDYARVTKQFFRWYKDLDERLESQDKNIVKATLRLYTYVEKQLRVAYKGRKLDSSAILSDKDIDFVVEKGCRSIKERCFVKMLHESGARIGEFINLKLKDIQIDDNRALLSVDGKTGPRTIPVVESIPLLTQWLSLHPFRDNQEAFLWTGDSGTRLHEPLRHVGAVKLISRCFERAGLRKKHNLHWFRHSRATLLAPKLTEAMMCKFLGWTLGSRMTRVYCHIDNKQLTTAVLEMHGLKAKDESKTQRIQTCACGAVNQTTSRYCFRCGRPISVAVMVQDDALIQTETNKTVQLLQEIMQNPELLKRFLEFKQGLEKDRETINRGGD